MATSIRPGDWKFKMTPEEYQDLEYRKADLIHRRRLAETGSYKACEYEGIKHELRHINDRLRGIGPPPPNGYGNQLGGQYYEETALHYEETALPTVEGNRTIHTNKLLLLIGNN